MSIKPILDFTKYSPFKDADLSDYLSSEECKKIEKNKEMIKYKDIANKLMFGGGKLEDQKLTPKNKETTKQLYKTLQVLLRSFAPPHEVKIATVAKLLHDHCDWID